MDPILSVPKKSPTRLPMADPQAPAGPNKSPNITGNSVAGRISVTPGIIGMDFEGSSSNMYMPAQSNVSATIVPYFHIVMISFTNALLGQINRNLQQSEVL
jgi:hypothetical protein